MGNRKAGHARPHSEADSREASKELLMTALGVSVPLYISEIRGHSTQWLLGEARRCADIVSTRGDVLQYGGKGCGMAFNALARGLAAAALISPNGITWNGKHWDAVGDSVKAENVSEDRGNHHNNS